MTHSPLAVALLLPWLLVAGAASSAAQGRPGTAPGTEDVVVRDAWVRESRAGGTTAAYLVIENRSARPLSLVALETPVTGTTELHTMRLRTGQGGGEMMSMVKVEEVPVPAGEAVTLAPGGYHAMLFGLTRPLAPGETVDLTLRFSNGVSRPITARVLSRAAAGLPGMETKP